MRLTDARFQCAENFSAALNLAPADDAANTACRWSIRKDGEQAALVLQDLARDAEQPPLARSPWKAAVVRAAAVDGRYVELSCHLAALRVGPGLSQRILFQFT